MTTDIRLLYVTAPNEAEASSLAEVIVGERLAACANILPGMKSVYWWQGTMEQGSECIVILKTRADLVAAATKRVQELHSYSVPCILELEVTSGNAAYINWLKQETKPA